MGAQHRCAPGGTRRVLQHGCRITGELGMVGAHRGVDASLGEEPAEDRVVQTRSPRGRDRGVDDLPCELVTEAQGVAVVDEEARLDARLDAPLTPGQRLAQDRDGRTI